MSRVRVARTLHSVSNSPPEDRMAEFAAAEDSKEAVCFEGSVRIRVR